MPPWLSHLRSAQRIESRFDSSRWVQLATIGSDNTPRVRTVVFRGWSDNYEMQIYTDKRSQKYQELAINNNVEICWLFSRSKCQFRFRGISMKVLGKEKLSHWDQLNNNAKTMWGWPNPGENIHECKKDDIDTLNKINRLDNFILLKIYITHVDQLFIQKPIHTRKRWIRKNGWIEERINP